MRESIKKEENEIKDTVDLTQKRDQENSHNDGKWKPADDGYPTGEACKQFRWNAT